MRVDPSDALRKGRSLPQRWRPPDGRKEVTTESPTTCYVEPSVITDFGKAPKMLMQQPSAEELRMQRKTQRLSDWAELFTGHIYMVLNRINPGMKLGKDAVQYISKVLILVLHEFVEEGPETISAVQDVIKRLSPTAWATFMVKHIEYRDNLDKSWIKRKDNKSRESDAIKMIMNQLKAIFKQDNKEKNINDRVIYYIQRVLDEIINDIIKWTSRSVNKFNAQKPEIDKRMLVAAIYTDRGLSELMECLIPGTENDYCACDIYQPVAVASASLTQKTSRFYDYNKICQKFYADEDEYLRDLSLLVNVFRRRLDKGIGDDPAGRQYINSIFGNIIDIYELTFKMVRAIEEVRELSTSPSMGTGLAEFSEGCEFESYTRFMEIFKEPVEDKLTAMLTDPRYSAFFDEEDKISHTSDGKCMRMAYKYVLPLYLHSVAAHLDGYYHYIKLLIKASRQNTQDYIDLKNFESHLKSVAAAISSLDLPPMQHKKYSRLRDEGRQPNNFADITKIQNSIEGWQGKGLGYSCAELIREGTLNLAYQTQSVKDTIRGKTFTERYVFLFDSLLVITKPLKNGNGYKYKQQIKLHASDVFDIADDDYVRNAFRVRVKAQKNEDVILFGETPYEKQEWLTSLVEVQTAGILHRLLDSYHREMEARAPLVLPTPQQYRFAEPDTDENINFEDYVRSSGIPVVKNGTLTKLVERLTYPGYVDNDYIKTFFMTYRSFCAPSELFDLLIERFNIPLPLIFNQFENVQSPPPVNRGGGPLAGRYDTVQSHGLSNTSVAQLEQAFMRFRRDYQKEIHLKVFCAFNHWIYHHFYDFAHDIDLLKKLKTFLSGQDSRCRITNDHQKRCKKLLDSVNRKEAAIANEEPTVTQGIVREQAEKSESNPKKTRTLVGHLPEVLWHHVRKGDIENYDLLTLHPVEIGRQVTLLHSRLYSAIKAVELADAAFTKKNKESPQLRKMTKHSTNLTFWIVRSIVETECLDERVEMLSRVLEIMSVLEQLNNFAGMIAFGSALTNSAVARLVESKIRLDKEKQACYEHFRELIFDDPRQKQIIEKMKNTNPPCVPFFGTYMTQLCFFGMQSHIYVTDRHNNDTNLINFVNCRKNAKIIKEVQLYQTQPYMFKAEPTIMQFFENLNPLHDFKTSDDFENYIHEQSKKIEPKHERPLNGKQKYPSEALKSPGIKTPTVKTPKALKSPSALNRLPHAGSPDESHFGIVDINPGQQPRYLGDSGRVNAGFSADTPLQTPVLAKNKSRRNGGVSSPSIDSSNHFRFPPTNPSTSAPMTPTPTMSIAFPTSPAPGALVLNKPPFGKGHHKPPAPPPPTGTVAYSTITRKKPPPPPPICEPSTSTSSASSPKPSESSTPTSPQACDMHADISLLKPGTPSMTPPKSPSVSLSVPLPPRARSPSETYDTASGSTDVSSPALCPPRPPKPSGSRHDSPVHEPPKPELEYLDTGAPAPPLPPKTYRKNFASLSRA